MTPLIPTYIATMQLFQKFLLTPHGCIFCLACAVPPVMKTFTSPCLSKDQCLFNDTASMKLYQRSCSELHIGPPQYLFFFYSTLWIIKTLGFTDICVHVSPLLNYEIHEVRRRSQLFLYFPQGLAPCLIHSEYSINVC